MPAPHQFFLAKFGDPLPRKHKICKAFPEYDVRLCQRGKDHFAVVYGMQVDDGLNYSQAARKLGEALMHAMACSEQLDNRMPGER